MHILYLLMVATNTIFINYVRITLKASCEISASSFKDFFSKGEKSAKNA